MANQPIPVSLANDMIQNYQDYIAKLGITGQTESVAFNSTALLNWMNSVKAHTDEFRIFLGVYPVGATNEGRLTTIIWPYKEGEPATGTVTGDKDDSNKSSDNLIDPFNEGGLSP